VLRVLLVAVLFGLAIRLTTWFGLYVPIPGSGVQMDVREILVILGSSLTGPLGGLVIGFLSGLGSSFRWFPTAAHMVAGCWSGWFFMKFVTRRTSTSGMIVSWFGLVVSYYYLVFIPFVTLGFFAIPELTLRPPQAGTGIADIFLFLMKALSPEFVFTLFSTTIILLMVPQRYRQSLWPVPSTVRGQGLDPRRQKGRLGVRLMAWFLSFSVFPLIVVSLFIRDDVANTVLLMEASKQREIARMLSREIHDRGLPASLSRLVQQRNVRAQSVFIIDTLGNCIACSDSSRGRFTLADIFPEATLSAFGTNKPGLASDRAHERAIGFAPVEGSGQIVVSVQTKEAISHVLDGMQRSIYPKLGVSLLLISIVGGAVIWVLVGRPMRRFTRAAREVGLGNFNVTLNPREMEDEIAVLAHDFNDMTDNLRDMHRDMEDEIAHRKATEEALREREKQFRLLAENSTDMISRHDLEGRYLYVSPSCRTLLGLRPEEVVGRSAYDFIHPDDKHVVQENHRRHFERKAAVPVEYRVVRKDGSWIWFESTSRLVVDAEKGAATEIHVSSRDVTQRLLAETALRESDQRLRTIVANMPVVLYSINRQGILPSRKEEDWLHSD